jgi:hypothetical protein
MGGGLLLYTKIADFFKAGNLTDLEVLLVSEKEHLNEDKNFGLAKQVLKHLSQKRISDLSQVYLTLSFKEILAKADHKSESKVEEIITTMVTEG